MSLLPPRALFPSLGLTLVLSASGVASIAVSPFAFPGEVPVPAVGGSVEFPIELYKGVESIGSPGSPGGLTTFAPGAWPVVEGGGVPVVAAAERDGGRAGRIVAFTHGGYLEPGILKQFDGERFLRNAAQWAGSGKRKAEWARVGGGDCKLGEELGMRIADDWREADVLIGGTGSVTPARLEDLRAFLGDGGALLLSCTPWGWQQLTPKLRLSRDLTLNRLMAPFGMVFDHRTASDSGPDSFRVGEVPRQLLRADVAFSQLVGGELAGNEAKVAKATVRAAIKALSDHEPILMSSMRDYAAGGATEFAGELADWLKSEADRRQLRPLSERWGQWHIIGPFAAGKRGSGALNSVLRVENDIQDWIANSSGPDLGQSWKGKKGKVAWHPIELAKDGLYLDVGELNLQEHIARGLDAKQRAGDWAAGVGALLYRRIEVVRKPGAVGDALSYDMRVSVDGGVRVWLDGVPVGAALGPAKGELAEVIPEVRFNLKLDPGVHHLVVKAVHTEGPWRFRARGDEGLDHTAVNAAIDRGVAHLIKEQYLDGSWPGYPGYGVGQTALNLYALAESGLARDHPSIQRGLAYLDAYPAKYVYSLGCEMLARAELDRGDQVLPLRRGAELMASWEEPTGLYAYPIHPNGNFLPDDVSNTLFAALALHAAHSRGVDVEPKIWRGMIEGTLDCMEREPANKSGRPPLGFSYRPHGNPTGSMTTAALSILLMARESLGEDLKRREGQQIEHALERGLAWLTANMTWKKDPGGGWHHFYLYGIERVGSLLGANAIGGVPWYETGAEFLISQQGKDGKWSSQQASVDTALALLFLNRATAPTSGEDRAVNWRLLNADGDVNVRAKVGEQLEVWLTGLGQGLAKSQGLDESAGMEVESVSWVAFVDGGERVVAEVTQGDASQRFAARFTPPVSTAFDLIARVSVVVPSQDGSVDPKRFQVESPRMHVPAIYSAAQLKYAHDHERNLLKGASCSASSSKSGCKPSDLIDANHETNWICEAKDSQPTWSAELATARPADRLLISHRGPRPEHSGLSRVKRVRVLINEGTEFELGLDLDLMKKTEVLFGSELRVKRVEIEILGATGSADTGFSEVQLVLGQAQ